MIAQGDDPQGDDARDVVDRCVDLPAGHRDGAAAAAEDGDEDHQEERGQGEGEEPCLAGAEERAQVVPEQVQGHHGCALGPALLGGGGRGLLLGLGAGAGVQSAVEPADDHGVSFAVFESVRDR